jgi:hypothetical protein
METHPYIGTLGAHETIVNYPPTINTPDTVFGWSGEEFEYYPEISDSDDESFSISYRDIPGWMIESNDSLVGTCPASTQLDSVKIACTDGFDTAYKTLYLSTSLCGDADGDSDRNLLDILFLISFIYDDPPGPAPERDGVGDVNSDGAINLLDILDLISFIYDNPPGPEPECM